MDWRQCLQKGLEHAAEGRVYDALRVLEDGLREAEEQKAQNWIVHFSRNAGLLYERSGDLGAAERSYRLAATHDESDPSVHFLLGRLYRNLGNETQARSSFLKCIELALKAGDTDLAEKVKSELGE